VFTRICNKLTKIIIVIYLLTWFWKGIHADRNSEISILPKVNKWVLPFKLKKKTSFSLPCSPLLNHDAGKWLDRCLHILFVSPADVVMMTTGYPPVVVQWGRERERESVSWRAAEEVLGRFPVPSLGSFLQDLRTSFWSIKARQQGGRGRGGMDRCDAMCRMYD